MPTLTPLLFRSTKLTLDFLDGRLFRYVPPLRLYIFSSLVLFFLVAMFFIVFDIEMAFLFPWVTVMSDLGRGLIRHQQFHDHALGGLGALAHAQLVQDVADVGLHRARADDQRLGDLAVHGLDRLEDPLAAVASLAVAQLVRLVDPGRGARRRRAG